MDDVIKLGEQIELYGFLSFDRGAMTILRKVIGNAARTLSERYPGFHKLQVTLTGQNPMIITAELTGPETKKGVAEGTNLFFTLDNALKQL